MDCQHEESFAPQTSLCCRGAPSCARSPLKGTIPDRRPTETGMVLFQIPSSSTWRKATCNTECTNMHNNLCPFFLIRTDSMQQSKSQTRTAHNINKPARTCCCSCCQLFNNESLCIKDSWMFQQVSQVAQDILKLKASVRALTPPFTAGDMQNQCGR